MKSAGLWNVSWGIFGPWKTSIKKKNWESTSSWKQIHTCTSLLALRKRANMEISIRLIAGGIPAHAPLLIKPSAEDRTLIKKPCRTVVPLNRGSGRAIAFFSFCGAIISDCSQSKDSRVLDAQTSTVRHTDSPICSHQTQRQTGEIKQSHHEFKISSRC